MEIFANDYKKGSPFPPRTNKKVLRFYNYRTCPFAERTNLVLKAKEIEHEVINVLLRAERPEWLTEKNPLGKVPIIEFDSDDKILYESIIVSEYLDEVFNGRKLRSNDPYIRAKDAIFVESLSPHLTGYGKALHSKDSDSVLWTGIQESLKKAEDLLSKRRGNHKYLSGETDPGFTDYMIWPFIERLPLAIDLVSNGINSEEYLRKHLPTIDDYRRQLYSDTTVKKVSLSYEVLLKHSVETRKLLLNSK